MINTEALKGHDDLISRHDNLISRHDDLISRRDDLLSRHDDLLSRHDDLLSRHDDFKTRRDDFGLLYKKQISVSWSVPLARWKAFSRPACPSTILRAPCMGCFISEVSDIRLTITGYS